MTREQTHPQTIARQLGISPAQVTEVLKLLADGGTVPFIARYRKEVTGSLDEVAIMAIQDQHRKRIEIDKRRATILESLIKNELLTHARIFSVVYICMRMMSRAR